MVVIKLCRTFVIFVVAGLCLHVQSYVTTTVNRLTSRSKLAAAKYDESQFFRVSIKKPLGLSLEEVAENANQGVYVCEVNDGNGKAAKVSKGMFLLEINGKDVKKANFDTVMDALIAAPAEKPIDLVFVDMKSITKGPAVLTVKTTSGSTLTINTLKGMVLRNVLLGSNIELYTGKAKLTNCGGGGSCGTCVVSVLDNPDWEERPNFEAQRLKKYPTKARLSCNTVIEGDATVIVSPPKIE